MLKDLLDSKKCFKLVCGAGNEDPLQVEKLTALYAKAGCRFFDVNASLDIVNAAKRGLEFAGGDDGYICVSVGIKGDPHVSKAEIDYTKCIGCGQCDEICPQRAIKYHKVKKAKCIGCGRCLKICPKGAISYISEPKDLSEVLPPLINAGIDCIELHAIGATTLDEYRKYIEKDKALERRFQPVFCKEPSVEDTISILRGLQPKYELHHGVRIKDEALVAAAVLSDRYLTNRFLPDKAIDLVDEAASQIKMEIESQPAELDNLHRKMLQLSIEKQALSRENDHGSKERLEKLNAELAEMQSKYDALHLEWQNEREAILALRSKKEELEKLSREEQNAERQGDLNTAAMIKHGKMPELQRAISEAEEKVNSFTKDGRRLLREEVTEDDIAKVVSAWTGVPVAKMMGSEKEKYLNLEKTLSESVIGQEKP